MKKLLFATLACLLLQCTINPSYAAIIIRQHTAVAAPAKNVLVENATCYMPGDGHHPTRNENSWEGIVSFICGLCGPLLCVPAIVFGAIGQKKCKCRRGLARAGFVLGICWAAIALLIALTMVAMYA